VSVHYRGSLINGLEFDSSFARGQPANFKVNEVIKGWAEILPLMRVGDYWRVYVPADLAYGDRGQPPRIGPNEALVFELKLVDIK
jgi:FKBP-type peptidyl-prolyl cis-trans isomerase FklB